MDDKTAEIALDCCNNNEVRMVISSDTQILLSRRIRDDPYLLQRILDMGNGKIPLDMSSIQWVDPKSLPQPAAPQSMSDDENDEWGQEAERKKGKKTIETESSDESVEYNNIVVQWESRQKLSCRRHKKKVPRIRLNEAMQCVRPLFPFNQRSRRVSNPSQVIPSPNRKRNFLSMMMMMMRALDLEPKLSQPVSPAVNVRVADDAQSRTMRTLLIISTGRTCRPDS